MDRASAVRRIAANIAKLPELLNVATAALWIIKNKATHKLR